MLFHASIGAADPAHTASVLAELLRGEAHPFPVFPGSFIVTASDEHGTAVEILPLGQVLVPGKTEGETTTLADADRPTETHLAIGTPLDETELHRIAAREWWISRTCNRGAFHVVEIWLENRILIEALTPVMQAEYRAFTSPGSLQTTLAGLHAPANDRTRRTPALTAR
jgi:hypothetical protein